MVYINQHLVGLPKVINQEYQVKITTQGLCLSPVDQRLADKLQLVFKLVVINMSISR